MTSGLTDIGDLLNDHSSKDEVPKTSTNKGWGKLPQPQNPPVQSLLEIEAEQLKEKEKLEEQKKPGVYQAKHGSYSRSSDGPTFESYNRESRPKQPTHSTSYGPRIHGERETKSFGREPVSDERQWRGNPRPEPTSVNNSRIHGERETRPFGREPVNDERQWRGNPRSEPTSENNVRPKLDIKPRTSTEEIGVKPSAHSEDPFGGASDQDKLKKQAEMQIQRETETAAKHKLTLPQNEKSNFGQEKDRSVGKSETENGGWRSSKSTNSTEKTTNQPNHDGDKYRYNRPGQNGHSKPSNHYSNNESSGKSRW
jgi:hypothetical protein